MSVRIITGIGRLYDVNMIQSLYSLTFIIEDETTLDKIKEVDENLESLFKMKIDGKDTYLINAKTRILPGCIDDEWNEFKLEDIKDGMYGRLSVSLSKHGEVWLYSLNNIQIISRQDIKYEETK